MGEGPRDDAARRYDLSVAVAGERAGGRASVLHPSVALVEQSYNARASFLGWFAKSWSASCLRETQRLEQRGAQSSAAAAHAAGEAGSLPTRAAKEESHTPLVFAHAHAGEDGKLWFCWRCGSTPHNG